MCRKILEAWEQTAEDFDEFISRNPGHLPSVLPQNLVLHCYCIFWYFCLWKSLIL